MKERKRSIEGGPTKRFFVSMLTKDIDLDDAILDLLDNCVDGAMRSRSETDASERRYKGFFAHLEFDQDTFSLVDNCGGIPTEVAEQSAFRLGRPDIDRDKSIPTIGMYGIGMKRAIFKMSISATIETQNKTDRLLVNYDKEWLNETNDSDWLLNLLYLDREWESDGTKITITELKKDASREFKTEAFEESLISKISSYYGYIIEKGFNVTVNGKSVPPATLRVYQSASKTGPAIEPYEFRQEVGGVHIRVVIGFRRSLLRGRELEESLEAANTAEDAGVSVLCNDRIILLNDKSRITGWGEGVAKYHNQFISIGGFIDIISNDAEKLPVSTTKRGVDVGSDVFLRAREKAIEGLKVFVAFTNKWKGREEDTVEFFKSADMVSARKDIHVYRKGNNLRAGGKRYIPELPLPNEKSTKKRILYFKLQDEINKVSEYIFDEKCSPSEVGEAAFDYLLEEAERNK